LEGGIVSDLVTLDRITRLLYTVLLMCIGAVIAFGFVGVLSDRQFQGLVVLALAFLIMHSGGVS
jgi:hypothetical protein